MKTQIISKLCAVCAVGVLAVPEPALAITSLCNATSCSNLSGGGVAATNPGPCARQTSSCYTDGTVIGSGFKINSCSSCLSGYTRKAQTYSHGSCGPYTWYLCEKSGGSGCDGTCDDCESTGWTSVGGGREQKITATCNTSTCVCSKTVQYRCSAGYWGTGIIDMSTGVGCTACASPGTSSAGTTSISGCCIPSGTTGTDSTGSYRYSFSCCWS